ncbi:MAG: thiosulfate oxidation carrier complex protein SoxZ, partial [Methylococcales bacterium]|nr:thiosulfate oxidation carrier complex protein SoxZ [Methylococcales bacterium]
MVTPTIRVKSPTEAKRGSVVEIMTLISHPMDTGLRKDKEGKVIPRNIINKFLC